MHWLCNASLLLPSIVEDTTRYFFPLLDSVMFSYLLVVLVRKLTFRLTQVLSLIIFYLLDVFIEN